MNAPPSVLKTAAGKQIRLGRELGKGGEGAVYESHDEPQYAAKLYWPNKAAERREKISAMVAAAWFKSNSFVAFPVEVLFGPNGTFVGFLMKRVGGHKPIHMLYSPSSRKSEFANGSFRFLVRSALNVARAVASVHATGCVIGDVNHSGFLVSNNATIAVIDSDSFQVIAGGRSFLCKVGTPEYTPPELQNSRFDRVQRTQAHDQFGLAVLIFLLLFMGRHPYSGRYQGKGEMPLERAISEFRFAYSSNIALTNMQPPPNVPLLSDFPSYLADAFEQAFGRTGGRQRPTAEYWVSVLEKLESEIGQCAANSAHHHVKGKQCPWCRMEQANPGFLAFVASGPMHVLPLVIDTKQIEALLNAIRDPGPTPDVSSVLQTLVHNLAQKPSNTASSNVAKYGGGLAASIVGFILLRAGAPQLSAIIACGVGLALSFYPHEQTRKLSEAKRQAEASWRAAKDAWSRQIANTKFVEIQKSARSLVRELEGLPSEEKRGLQQLEQRKREDQLNRFLDHYRIASARIKKIGSGRKAVLASFGIETAADIERSRFATIPGFGPTLIAELLKWRASVEAKFIFNAKEPINPANIASVKAAVSAKKANLENQIRSAIGNLQQAANFANSQRQSLASSVGAAHSRFKQAEADERAIHPVLVRVAKIVSGVCLAIALLNLGAPRSVEPSRGPAPSQVVLPKPSPASPQTTRPSASSQPLGRSSDAKPTLNQGARGPELGRASTSEPLSRPPFGPPTVPPSPPPTAVPSPPSSALPSAPSHSTQSPFADVMLPPKVHDAQPAAPPLPPPVQIPPVGGERTKPHGDMPSSDETPTLDLTRRADITRVQTRLIELGYRPGAITGHWTQQATRAVQEFRANSGLAGRDLWDRETESRLFSGDAVRAKPISNVFEGGWTTEAGLCADGSSNAPLRITKNRAVTTGGYCSFNSVKAESESAWRISARCFVSGQSWSASIQLRLQNDQLVWTSEKGTTRYYRCPS